MKKVCLFIFLLLSQNLKAQRVQLAENAVYQYAVNFGSTKAYLWIPPKCKRVKGILISFNNLLERNWLEDPIIRKCAAKENLGIVLIEASDDGFTPDLKNNEPKAFLKILKDMGRISGYSEIEYAPFIPIDHSTHGVFTWTLPALFPGRTIATIPVKTFALPAKLDFTGIPLCYIVGENDEWIPVKNGTLFSRDFVWPEIRRSAVQLRTANDNNLISVVTDPGGGHLDWSDKLSNFMALYIHKACEYRLPKKTTLNKFPKLRSIKPESGWLTDTGGLKPDKFKAAPYKKYKGDPQKAYWFFEEETAKAAAAFAGDRMVRKQQMLTFVQNGERIPMSKRGAVTLQYLPEQDGIAFDLKGDFLSTVPPELIGAGDKLGHASGEIKFRVITGPAVQIAADKFQIQFNRSAPGGDVWIQEEQAGDKEYKHAVQPGQIKVPAKLTNGQTQTITFPKIPDQKVGIKQISLAATSSSGLPVRYYIESGPAVTDSNVIKFTSIPVKSHYPVKVTVVAYQWGRIIAPLYQSADAVTQSFWILK